MIRLTDIKGSESGGQLEIYINIKDRWSNLTPGVINTTSYDVDPEHKMEERAGQHMIFKFHCQALHAWPLSI